MDPKAVSPTSEREIWGSEALGKPIPEARSETPDPALDFTLWGPSAAGKTALLAQLHLHLENRVESRDTGWDTFPANRETVDFFNHMRSRLTVDGLFPPATPVSHEESLLYSFRHRMTGRTAELVLEDRAGALFERHDDRVRERLRSSDALILLFDPQRDPMRLRGEILHALEEIHAERPGGEPDPRPIAVCLSKADLLIRRPADFIQAREAPDAFVRRHLDSSLVRSLERYCANYRLFPLSAVGLDVGWGVVSPRLLVDEQGRVRPVPGGRHLDLSAPFIWAFESLDQSLDRARALQEVPGERP